MAIQQLLLGYGAAGAPPVPWTPADLAAPPVAWFNDTSGTTESGGTISIWLDCRANGMSMSQATGSAQPTVNATGLDGKRTLEFMGAGDFMVSTTMAPLSNAAAFMGIVAVYQNRSSSANVRTVLGFSNDTNGVRMALQASRTSNTNKPSLGVRRLDGDSFASISGTSTGTDWCFVGARMNYAAGDGFVDVNGVLADVSDLSLTTSGNVSATDSATVRAGTGSATTPATPWADMNLAELMVFTTALSDTDLDKLYGWLAHKWGLEALLDVAHPYKASPP